MLIYTQTLTDTLELNWDGYRIFNFRIWKLIIKSFLFFLLNVSARSVIVTEQCLTIPLVWQRIHSRVQSHECLQKEIAWHEFLNVMCAQGPELFPVCMEAEWPLYLLVYRVTVQQTHCSVSKRTKNRGCVLKCRERFIRESRKKEPEKGNNRGRS